MHDECHVCFGLRCQHTGRGETRIVDEQRVFASFPWDAIRRIADNGIKWFIVSVQRIQQRVAQLNIEVVVVDVVQKHVDTTKVVGGGVDFPTVVF